MAINDFNIGFLGKLDGTRSKNQINQDIKALKRSLNSLEIKATLDPQQKNALTRQLNLLQVSLDDASFSPKALNDLVSQVNNALTGIQINIPNINTSAAGKSAIQAGQQIGNQIQNGINSSIQKQDLWKNFGFSANNQNNVAKEAQKYFAGISNGIVTVQEHMSEIDGDSSLDRFIVNIKNAKGEVESLNYSLKNITDSNGNATGQHFAYTSGSVNDTGAIKQFQQMEKIVTDYQIKLDNLKTKYANANVDFSGFTDVFDKFKNGAASTNDLALAFSNLTTNVQNSVNNLKSQSSSFDPIQQTLNNMRDLPSVIQNLETNMSGLSDKTSVAGIDIKDLQSTYATLLAEMNTNGGKVPMSDAWIKSYQTLTSTVAGATKQVETLKKSEAKAGKINLTQELSKLQRLTKVNTIEKWYKNNTAAAKLFGNELKEIIAEYKNFNKVMTKSDSNKLLSQVKSIEIASREVNKLGFSFGDKLKNTWEKFGGWSIATGTMMRGFQEIKKGVGFIEELDDALTDVNYTTPMTSDNLVKLANDSVNMAKELKTSASNVLEAVKIYSTANTTSEEILNKSRASIMLSNVSGMSGEDSSQTIQTVLNQFELDSTNENLMGIVDTLEYVSSQLNYDFSKGITEITSGISESGNVAKQAGLSLEEYAAILGTTIERSGIAGSQAGNAYKTIFSRITGASETEGTMDEDISKAETSLRSVGIQVRDTEDEFRDLTDIMSDLGSVWDSLSSTEKSNVGYNVAG